MSAQQVSVRLLLRHAISQRGPDATRRGVGIWIMDLEHRQQLVGEAGAVLLYDLFAIDERFVHLNHSALTDHRSEITRAHRFVDIASQEPGRLIGHL
jgi:hypothetical protein